MKVEARVFGRLQSLLQERSLVNSLKMQQPQPEIRLGLKLKCRWRSVIRSPLSFQGRRWDRTPCRQV